MTPLRVSLGLLANSCTFSPVGESHIIYPLLVSLNYSSKYARSTPKNTSAVCIDEIIFEDYLWMSHKIDSTMGFAQGRQQFVIAVFE